VSASALTGAMFEIQKQIQNPKKNPKNPLIST
jgi:hypothetical protein